MNDRLCQECSYSCIVLVSSHAKHFLTYNRRTTCLCRLRVSSRSHRQAPCLQKRLLSIDTPFATTLLSRKISHGMQRAAFDLTLLPFLCTRCVDSCALIRGSTRCRKPRVSPVRTRFRSEHTSMPYSMFQVLALPVQPPGLRSSSSTSMPVSQSKVCSRSSNTISMAASSKFALKVQSCICCSDRRGFAGCAKASSVQQRLASPQDQAMPPFLRNSSVLP